MPPSINDASLHLCVQQGLFFVSKYWPEDTLPEQLLQALALPGSHLLSLTRTLDEVSIVGQWHEGLPSKLEQDATWRCFKIVGPLDFGIFFTKSSYPFPSQNFCTGLTGIMADLTAPLKTAKLSVFAISTW